MKPTSKEFLEEVSKHCSNQITYYKFNKTTLHISNKYRGGRLAALKYIGELSFYYLQEEKSIKHKFREQILKQIQQNSCLNDNDNDNDYKDGLYDALNVILIEYKTI